jgi:hypothetical protein
MQERAKSDCAAAEEEKFLLATVKTPQMPGSTGVVRHSGSAVVDLATALGCAWSLRVDVSFVLMVSDGLRAVRSTALEINGPCKIIDFGRSTVVWLSLGLVAPCQALALLSEKILVLVVVACPLLVAYLLPILYLDVEYL